VVLPTTEQRICVRINRMAVACIARVKKWKSNNFEQHKVA
jgi:hypothetical protein